MKTKKYLFVILISILFFCSGCQIQSKENSLPSKNQFELDFPTAKKNEDNYTFTLSSDESYYIVTGLSKLGQSIVDYSERLLMANETIFLKYFSTSIRRNFYQMDEMNFELHIPENYQGKPVRELGENCFSNLERYSIHYYLPESITTIRSNAIRLSTPYLADLGGLFSTPFKFILSYSQLTWNIGDNQIVLDPLAILNSPYPNTTPIEIQLSKNNPWYVFENNILMNKEKTIVYFGTDFSSWKSNAIDSNQVIIPEGIEEIKEGFFFTSNEDWLFDKPSLTIVIPSTLKDLSTNFFDLCFYEQEMNLLNPYVIPENQTSFIWENNCFMNQDKTKLYYVKDDAIETTCNIAQSIKEVGGNVVTNSKIVFPTSDTFSLDYLFSYFTRDKSNLPVALHKARWIPGFYPRMINLRQDELIVTDSEFSSAQSYLEQKKEHIEYQPSIIEKENQ